MLKKFGTSLNQKLHRLVDAVTPRQPSPPPQPEWIDRVLQLAPMFLSTWQTLKAQRMQQEAAGPHEQQVRAEFHAEHTVFDRELAEKMARLVAAFGPRFVEARKLDAEQRRPVAPASSPYVTAAIVDELRAAANGHSHQPA